ncbi:MAG: hydrogenase formation protein HypD [Caldiserica bacterium]|nr:hydrogenase formation protein HypD [Caldisericota bacterium]
MKYIEEFRDPALIKKIIKKTNSMVEDYGKPIQLMEVCGTHTVAISRSGLRKLFHSLKLLSGPGCPVCVTPNHYMDKSIAYSRRKEVIITTFGDMMRVPGSTSSLEREKAEGRDVRVVYSALDALQVAKDNPEKKVIFLGVGFETTTPTVALTIKQAKRENLKNFFVYSGHKLIPPAMEALLEDSEVSIDGFICPGHVSTIIGSLPYEFIPDRYNIPCVITGFEPLDVAEGIAMLVEQIVKGEKPTVQIQYTRSVKREGNRKAVSIMQEVFRVEESNWRGVGTIPGSGLKIGEEYSQFDSERNIQVEVEPTKENAACICGDILRGVKSPLECKLFRKGCTPEHPVGACMVSSEGTCAAYFKYEG